MAEKAKGKMKEAAGAVPGNEDRKAEGSAQQQRRKGAAREEAIQKERTPQGQLEAKQAEKERDGQGLKGEGPLSVTHTSAGR